MPWPDRPHNESVVKIACGSEHTVIMTCVEDKAAEKVVGETSTGVEVAKMMYTFGLKCYTRRCLEIDTPHEDDIFALVFPKDSEGRCTA